MNDDLKFKLASIGIQTANILTNNSSSALEQAALYLYNGLKQLDVSILRLYIYDEKSEGFDEEIYIEQDTLFQGNDYIPAYQLPFEVLSRKVFHAAQGNGYVTKLPLYNSQDIIGLIEIFTYRKLDDNVLEILCTAGEAAAAGVCYQREKKASEKNSYYFDAIMQISKDLQAVSSIEELMHTFSAMTIDLFKFDRVTIFVYDSNCKDPLHNLCMTSRGESKVLEILPKIPELGSEPAALGDLSGYWIPLRIKDKEIGCILVDNIYTMSDISSNSVDILTKLCSLVSLQIDNIKLFEDVNRYAQFDDLTGSYNRRMGINLLNNNIRMAKIRREPFTLCYSDLNNMKAVNDTLGHTTGDNMLAHYVSLIKETVRKGDIIARMGGDEFIILFPNCRIDDAEQIWSRVTERMAEINKQGLYPYKLNSSHGMIEFCPDDSYTSAQLLSKADRIMYKEKDFYRNMNRL